MARIPDEVIEQVRDAADIVGLIGQSVDLKKSGSDWRGPCPFHGGTGRNFSVHPRRQAFHCFVCHEKGDIFSYQMKRYGMDYPTAIRDIATRVGITIPERTERQGPDPHEHLFAACAAAQDWFATQLREHPDAAAARTYLAEREIPDEAAAVHGLGYAPRGRDFFAAMGRLGISDATLLESGLAVARDGGPSPRFRHRVLFPIHDLRGRVVAFGGRSLDGSEPKYLNSPETPVFGKGRMLYNLHAARHAIRKAERALVVEGYFDVLRLVLAGIEEVVAPLGTALTEEQATLLTRFTDTVITLYDSDAAGLKATFRAGDVLLGQRLRVRVATMPEGEDPDTLVRAKGAEQLEQYLRDAVDVLERKLQLLDRRGWLDDVSHRREALDRLLPTIRAAADPVTRDLYVGRVAERLQISRDTVRDEAAREVRRMVPAPTPPAEAGFPGERRPDARPARGRRGRPAASDVNASEVRLMRLLVTDPAWLDRARSEVDREWFGYAPFRELFDALVQAGDAMEPDTLAEAVGLEARAALGRLVQLGPLAETDTDQQYADLCAALEARPFVARYDIAMLAYREALHAGEAAAAEAKRELDEAGAALRARFPVEWSRRFARKRGQGRGAAPAEPADER